MWMLLLKICLLTTLFYSLYHWALRGNTFFRFNRVYLLAGMFIALALPFIPLYYAVPTVSETDLPETAFRIGNIISIEMKVNESVNFSQIGCLIYISGLIVFLLSRMWTVFRLFRCIRSGSKEVFCGIVSIETPMVQSSFSFLRYIVLPQGIKEVDKNVILAHEETHIRQWHCVDLLLGDIFCIIQWFNPIAWLYKRDLVENHEFLADSNAGNVAGSREAQRRRQREEAERREQIRISRDHRQRTTQMERQSLMGPMDLPFLLLTLLLTGVGLVMVFSASFPSAYYETGDGAYYFKRQLIFAVLGLFAMVVMSRINYQRLRGASKLLLGFAVFLLVLVIVPKNPLAITNNNATRWLGTEGFSFQPSEIAKLAVVIYFADSISKKKRKMETWRYGIVPYLAVLGLIAILMMLEPHLSGTILIVGTGIVMMIVGGIQRWLVAAGLGGVGIVAVLYVQLVEKGIIQYGKGRIDTWRDPFNEAWFHGDGWQISQSLIAIGSGGLLGVGLGKSRQKFLYLPEEHNDCIFAVVCEELGLIGACVVMLLFALLILRGFWIALHAKDRFGTLMVVGIMTLISLQTFLNIAVVTGLIPATGISLPFFSYGGTALALQLFEMGIVLSVSRQIPAPRNG